MRDKKKSRFKEPRANTRYNQLNFCHANKVKV